MSKEVVLKNPVVDIKVSDLDWLLKRIEELENEIKELNERNRLQSNFVERKKGENDKLLDENKFLKEVIIEARRFRESMDRLIEKTEDIKTRWD